MSKVIITHLIEGSSTGLKSVVIANRTCNAFFATRDKYKQAKDREELNSPAFYLLFGDEKNENKVYVGETGSFIERVKDHERKKDFWNAVIIFSGKLTKSDVLYLQYLAIEQIKKANRVKLEENSQNPKCPQIPDYQAAAITEFFEDAKLLTNFLGYNLFKTVEENKEQIFYCKNTKGTKARGFYDVVFTVLAGSKIRKNTTDSFGTNQTRDQLIEENCRDEGDYFLLEKNLTFTSPSAASNFCLGKNSNGWTEWKDQDGKSLSEIFRTSLEG